MMDLVEIKADGIPARKIVVLPEIAADVMKSAVKTYQVNGYQPPWIGYLAIDEGTCVGTCAFKNSPVNGRVEIAYFTFPGNEGRGVASSMAKKLLELAMIHDPKVQIFAQTLPEQNASTRVLEKLGFKQTDEIYHPEDGRVWEWELIEEAQPHAEGDGDSTSLHPRQ